MECILVLVDYITLVSQNHIINECCLAHSGFPAFSVFLQLQVMQHFTANENLKMECNNEDQRMDQGAAKGALHLKCREGKVPSHGGNLFGTGGNCEGY